MENTIFSLKSTRLILLIALFCHALTLYSQDLKLPQIIPPSPDAASLGKFGDIPVSTYTGIPSVSIPLFTATSRDISLPILLSYHASGIHVEEESSWIGLGWALNAGGMISRTVRGNDDLSQTIGRPGYVYSQEIPPQDVPIPNTNPQLYSLPYNYVDQANQGATDPQPDIFSYNFLGYSGKFFLRKKNGTASIEAVLQSNNEKISIKYNESSGQWIILTKEGIRAVFSTKEYTNTLSGAIPNPSIMPNPLTWEAFPDVVTSWYLDGLYSPAGGSIIFEYDIPSGQPKPVYASRSIISVSDTKTRLTSFTIVPGGPDCAFKLSILGRKYGISCLTGTNPGTVENNPCSTDAPSFSGSMNITWNIYLKRIVYANGEIKFNTSERSDIQEHTNGSQVFVKPRKLDAIEIYENGRFLRSFNFTQSYYNGNASSDFYLNKRLKLDQVIEKNGTIAKKPYVFSYIGDNTISSTFLPAKNSAARDHWGLYNGKTANNYLFNGYLSYVPQYSFIGSDGNYYTVPGVDRDADEESSKQGILEKITYPTGGNTKLFYEAHKVTVKETVDLPLEKGYFVNTDEFYTSKVFELNNTTGITINSAIKCQSLPCYPGGGTGTQCSFPLSIYDVPYVTITNLFTGADIYVRRYSDYECKFYSTTTTCPLNVVTSFCGINRMEEITLPAGRYMLKTNSLSGYLSMSNLSYNLKQFSNPQSNVVNYVGGGLRVKKIIDHDGINTANDIVKTYDYTTKNANGEILSTGKLMTIPKYHTLEFGTVVAGGVSQCIKVKSTSYSNVPLGSSAQGSPVGYDKVTVRYGENGENGYSVFEYKNDPDIETEPYLPNSPTVNHGASNGLLRFETHYTRDRFKLKQVENQYVLDPTVVPPLLALTTYKIKGALGFKKYQENSEWWKLTSKSEKIFDATDIANSRNQEDLTTFTYGANHKLPTQTYVLSSKGTALTTLNYYPFDVQDPLCQEMWDSNNMYYKHMHSQVVKQEMFETTGATPKFISGIKNKYVTNAIRTVELKAIEKAQSNGVYENRILFENYDNSGNLLQVRKTNDAPISYLYGYESASLPIAQATNAKWDQIYYQSFEYDPTASNNLLLAHSGRKYKTTSFAIPFAPPAGLYQLSYWKYTNPTWSQVIQSYSGPITISGERLDDIRVYPIDSQMTTFNYDPLTGVITSTDLNNQSTHFEYDELQRLIKIKDLEYQPVSGYKYVYKN